MRSNLTTKRGDSGSAGLLEEKCVMIQAPKFDTKMSKNWSPTLKMTKNDQKWQNTKNSKIMKMQKSEKVTKYKNTKSVKVRKSEKWKSDQKKWQKVTPPQKGQNVT